jgi:hypothetical protein
MLIKWTRENFVSTNNSDAVAQGIDRIEAIQSNDIEAARKSFRLLLFNSANSDEKGSIGDALALLVENKTLYRDLAAIVLRCLAIRNLVPENNPNNQIARSVVQLVSGSLPDLCEFVGLSQKLQTYESFAILQGTHARICALLTPLQLQQTTPELFLATRHPTIQSLHHSAVAAYCAPFGIAEAATRIEQIYSLIRKINTSDPAGLQHQIRIFITLVDECKAGIGTRTNFFITDYFLRFLNAASDTVASFLAEKRGRFIAPIVPRLAQDNSIPKRYPLEEGREFTILIPLRNNGPGAALNVQAQISHDEGHIYFGTTTTNIGTVAPGDFAVAFDALVIATCAKVTTILTISWEEMGNLDRKSLVQEVEICAQRLGVPWGKLQYLTPYSTAVAKGEEFVGRSEKVVALASKMLRTPMEPFYVTGQKRIGKTSLALAAADFAKAQSEEIEYRYVLWGSIAYEDPRNSVNALGKALEDLIKRTLPSPEQS